MAEVERRLKRSILRSWKCPTHLIAAIQVSKYDSIPWYVDAKNVVWVLRGNSCSRDPISVQLAQMKPSLEPLCRSDSISCTDRSLFRTSNKASCSPSGVDPYLPFTT